MWKDTITDEEIVKELKENEIEYVENPINIKDIDDEDDESLFIKIMKGIGFTILGIFISCLATPIIVLSLIMIIGAIILGAALCIVAIVVMTPVIFIYLIVDFVIYSFSKGEDNNESQL